MDSQNDARLISEPRFFRFPALFRAHHEAHHKGAPGPVSELSPSPLDSESAPVVRIFHPAHRKWFKKLLPILPVPPIKRVVSFIITKRRTGPASGARRGAVFAAQRMSFYIHYRTRQNRNNSF